MPRKPMAEQLREEREYVIESDPFMTVVAYGPGRHGNAAQVRSGEVGKEIETFIDPVNSEAGRFANKIVHDTSWVPTDAWRGVHHTPDEFGDYVKVVDTWVSPMGHSGDWETQHQVPIEEIITKWKEPSGQPPVPVFVVYTTTSNLFSVGFDMYVKKSDQDAFVRYLREAKIDERDLKNVEADIRRE
jgi:hypothetical protein